MEVTVAEQQGSGREAVAERSWRQTPDQRNTNRQRGRVRATSVLGNAKSKNPSRAHQVEPVGTGGKLTHLPGETSGPRGQEESAEAVVAKKAGESRTERRAEGTRRSYMEHCEEGKPVLTSAARNGHPAKRSANPAGLGDSIASSQIRGATPCTHVVHELTATSEDLMDAIRPRSIVRAGLQPPDAENRTSGGVGASAGLILPRPPDRGDKSEHAERRRNTRSEGG